MEIAMRFVLYLLYALLLGVLLPAHTLSAAPKHRFKIASLAPEGSIWVKQFKLFTDEVQEKTGGEVAFRVYPGGVMGDDLAMYRKMRVGQLNGGGFTMTGIAKVVPDFRVMSIPFLFDSYDEVDEVTTGLLPLFRKRFDEEGMVFIAMTEVGFIYTMSTKPIATMPELQQATSWIPAGDPIATVFLSSLGITPVQLSIPDVLSSLQTGLVDTVYNSLYGSIIMQWFTKARYVTDTPFGYAYGVFLLDKKKFNKLSQVQKDIIFEAADKHFAVLMDETRKSNRESRSVLEKQGVTFVKATTESTEDLCRQRDVVVEQLTGKAFSREAYTAVSTLLEKSRQGRVSAGSK